MKMNLTGVHGEITRFWTKANNLKIKRVEVLSGKRLGCQKHRRRAGHWFVARGTAKVTLNGAEIPVKTGEAIDIALGDAHRAEKRTLRNWLVFIENQIGKHFGKHVIIRLGDYFGGE